MYSKNRSVCQSPSKVCPAGRVIKAYLMLSDMVLHSYTLLILENIRLISRKLGHRLRFFIYHKKGHILTLVRKFDKVRFIHRIGFKILSFQ